MHVMKKTALALAMAALLIVSAQAAMAAKSIKLHHLNPNGAFDNPSGASVLVFKNLVEAGTNGGITVEIFPNSQLGKDNEVLQQVKAGIIQMGVFSTGGVASVYPLISVLDVPFAFPALSVAYEVLDGPFGKKLANHMSAKTGMKVLGFSDSGGFFHLTNSKRPIKTPEDMKGLKFRTMGLQTHQLLVSSLGGQPVSISWSEVYTALQTGVADGQMNPIPIVEFAKLYEVQKYLTLTDHLFAPQVWMVNQKFWEGLTPEEQKVIEYASKAAIVTSRGIANAIEASDRGLPGLQKHMEVNSLTSEEKAKFQEIALPPVREYLEKEFGTEGREMLEEFLEAVKRAS